MMGRVGLGAAVLALIGWAAAAAPIPGTDQQVGSWIVQADDDGSGKFAYCDATRDDGGGTLVQIGQSASGSGQIGFTNAGWQFAVGQDVTVTLFIDRVPYPLVLRTLSATTFSTPLPDTTLVDALRQGYMLTLQLGGVYRTFPLDGSTAAINAAALCQQQRSVASAAPSPAAPPAASPASPQAAVPSLPAAPAAAPAPGGMPPEVAQEVSNLQSNCQVMNKTPPPIGDYVTRIGLTGDGTDDWLINTGGISCAGLTGGGGSERPCSQGLRALRPRGGDPRQHGLAGEQRRPMRRRRHRPARDDEDMPGSADLEQGHPALRRGTADERAVIHWKPPQPAAYRGGHGLTPSGTAARCSCRPAGRPACR